MIHFSKRFRLALVIFIPLIALVSIFAGVIYNFYHQQIEGIDQHFADQAVEIPLSYYDGNPYLDEFPEDILYEEDPYYEFEEVDIPVFEEEGDILFNENGEIFTENEFLENPESATGIFFYPEDPENMDPNDPFSANFISLEEIEAIEAGIAKDSLSNIILVLAVTAIGLGGLAWFLALRSLKPLELALEKQKEFVANASHELRTPLAMIKTEAEVLLRNKKFSADEARDFMNNTIEDINHLDTLTTQLIKISQVDLNRPNQETEISPKEDWDTLKTRFTNRSKQENKKFIIGKIAADKLINPNVGFKNILQIVLDNAFKYTLAESTITVSTEDKKSYLIVSIHDTGVGITPSALPHIFERFYRADTSRTSAGFGLGLALAKESLEKIGGKITVTSQIGNGSEFKIWFPKA